MAVATVTAAVVVAGGTLTLLDKAGNINDSFQKLCAGRGRHNLVMGKPAPGDQLLYEEKIRKGHDFIPVTYQTHIFRYRCKANENISCVIVKDGWDDDTGGNPDKQGGGPGESYVEIKVTSQFGRGMDFTFYVYGRK